MIATGLNVSPGAAVGTAVFDPDTAQRLAGDGRAVILLRAGDQARRRARHARRPGHPDQPRRAAPATPLWWPASSATPPSSGQPAWRSTPSAHRATVGDHVIEEGDWISLDGGSGHVYAGRLDTFVPDLDR